MNLTKDNVTNLELKYIDQIETLANALKVIAFDPRINAWLANNDPKALTQVLQALGSVGEKQP